MANPSYLPVISLWLVSAVCYLVAYTSFDLDGLDWKAWLREHRWELIAISVVTLLAAILRLYKLGSIPRVINGDEGWVGLIAQTTSQNPLANPFAIWNNFSAFYLQAENYTFFLFGATAFSVRLLTSVGGTLSVLATYLLSRQIAGRRVALIAAISNCGFSL